MVRLRSLLLAGATIVVVGGAVGAAAGGCSEPEARRIRLRRVQSPMGLAEGGCLPPVDAQQVRVTALGDFAPVAFSDAADRSLGIDLFPGQTRSLSVESLGAGLALLSVGRTGTLSEADLATEELPVYVAPPRSFCAVGGLGMPRVQPVVARAGRRVLVTGGSDAAGEAVPGAELYDPATARFEPAGEGVYFDLRGGQGITLADERVLLLWENGFQIYDAGARAFGPPTVPNSQDVHVRASSQAVRLGDGRVLVAGGCAQAGLRAPCAAATEAQLYDPGSGTFAPTRALAVARAGGSAVLDEAGRVWLVGGVGADGLPTTQAELWDAQTSVVAGPIAGSVAAPLLGGGFFAGFAGAASPPSANVAVVPPFGGSARDRTPPSARAGTSLTVLDDGALLVVGGRDTAAAGTEALLYHPHDGTFEALVDAPATVRSQHGAVLLDDGTVLVVGGRDPGGAALGDAWIYRHDLAGPWSSVGPQTFREDAPLIVPGDPGFVRVDGEPPRLVLGRAWSAAPLSGWALLAGPTYAAGDVNATLAADDGVGAGILFGYQGAGDWFAALAPPGAKPSLVRVVAGAAAQTLCRGSTPVPTLTENPAAHELTLRLRPGHATLAVDGETLLDCELPAGVRGSVGVGVIAPGAGELNVSAFIADRVTE